MGATSGTKSLAAWVGPVTGGCGDTGATAIDLFSAHLIRVKQFWSLAAEVILADNNSKMKLLCCIDLDRSWRAFRSCAYKLIKPKAFSHLWRYSFSFCFKMKKLYLSFPSVSLLKAIEKYQLWLVALKISITVTCIYTISTIKATNSHKLSQCRAKLFGSTVNKDKTGTFVGQLVRTLGMSNNLYRWNPGLCGNSGDLLPFGDFEDCHFCSICHATSQQQADAPRLQVQCMLKTHVTCSPAYPALSFTYRWIQGGKSV